MKLVKNIILCISIMMCCIAMVGCGSAPSSTSGSVDVTESVERTSEPMNLIDEMDVDFYSCNIDDTFYYTILTVTNNSDKVVKFEANFMAKDDLGNDIGATTADNKAIAPGQTACIWSTIDYTPDISSFDYTLTVDEDTENRSIYDDVLLEYNSVDDKVLITATNNGTDTAYYVWAQVLFFKDGQLVNFSEPMFTDDDSELKAGATSTQEAVCYSEGGFDNVKVFVSGRK